jgi:hypothetical protein
MPVNVRKCGTVSESGKLLLGQAYSNIHDISCPELKTIGAVVGQFGPSFTGPVRGHSFLCRVRTYHDPVPIL